MYDLIETISVPVVTTLYCYSLEIEFITKVLMGSKIDYYFDTRLKNA